MKTQRERIENRCVHFTGVQHQSCAAGVKYDDVKDTTKRPYAFPCFKDDGCTSCEKRRFPTEDEVNRELEERDASFKRMMAASRAAHDDAENRGLRKGCGGQGSVKCPCCSDGTIHYQVAGYNGHMHARCSTTDCVSWME